MLKLTESAATFLRDEKPVDGQLIALVDHLKSKVKQFDYEVDLDCDHDTGSKGLIMIVKSGDISQVRAAAQANRRFFAERHIPFSIVEA